MITYTAIKATKIPLPFMERFQRRFRFCPELYGILWIFNLMGEEVML